MAMQLFGISKTALDSFLAALVVVLAASLQPMPVNAFNAVGPYVSSDHLGVILAGCTLGKQRTIPALRGIRDVMPITIAIRRPIRQDLPGGAAIMVDLGFIAELAFLQSPFAVAWSAVTNHSIDTAHLQPAANGCCLIPGIQTDHLRRQTKTRALSIQA